MKRIVLALLVTLALTGCKETPADAESQARLRLTRAPDGLVEITLSGAAAAPRAAQVELTIESQAGYIIEDVAAPEGLAIDRVRAEMRGTNRAILFAGDRRGVRMSRAGPLARFRVTPTGEAPGGIIRITKALLVNTDGSAADVTLGSGLPLR